MDSITTTEKDLTNVRQLWLYVMFMVFSLGWGIQQVTDGNTAGGVIFVVLAGALGYQAWNAFTTRTSVVTIDSTGVTRAGGWGWHMPWSKIAAIEIDDFNSRDYLVIMRHDPKAPNHPSSAYLWGSNIPKNALTSPIPWDKKDDVAAVLARYWPAAATGK